MFGVLYFKHGNKLSSDLHLEQQKKNLKYRLPKSISRLEEHLTKVMTGREKG